jgi:putative PIN family toxin of toxin-antitoxin system
MEVSNPLVVPDTNVIVSGTLSATSPPAQIINAWKDNRLQAALSPSILAEVEGVFTRPYFVQRGWSAKRASQFAVSLRASAITVPGTTPVDVCRDPTDNSLFACAIEAQADYIVSGDTRHVLPVGTYQGIPVVSPREFIEVFEQFRKIT